MRFQPRSHAVSGRSRRDAKALAVPLVAASALIYGMAAQGAPPRRQVLWTFDHSLTNALGGGYNVFFREPSRARTYLDPAVNRSQSDFSLRITAHRADKGFCGVWFNFYPSGSSPRYFDARPYPYLTFWVKGVKPGGDFDIKLVDSRDESQGDAAAQPLHAYLPSGITTRWQKVTIPVADFTRTDPSSLVRMVFIFSVPGDYEFYVDNIGFESEPNGSTAAASAAGQQPTIPKIAEPYHSMWVWKTSQLLNNSQAATRLFDFCARMGFKEIYLSVNFKTSPSGRIPASIADARAYGKFLRAAHQRGLRVEALSGAPLWAAQAYHARALGAVRAILDFNAAMPAKEQFDGIHFDVEPYLLLGFSVPNYRRRLLQQYLEMVAACAAAARQAHTVFTCDIPWWFYPATPAARQEFTVAFRGTEKTVGEHVTDLLDSVTVMDYRNEADGAGGIIRFAIPALAYAAKVHKRIRIGLETSVEKPTAVKFVAETPARKFFQTIRHKDLMDEHSFEGYALHVLKGKGVVFVGLGPLLHSNAPPAEPMDVALGRLRKLFGQNPSDLFTAVFEMADARAAVVDDPAWQDFKLVELARPGSGQKQAAFQAVRCTPPVTTFHGLGRKVFEQQSRSAADWLARYPSFSGLAIHYYQSLRTLMDQP